MDDFSPSNDKFELLKGDYFLQKLFGFLIEKKMLEIPKFNKKLQKRLNLNINNYKNFAEKYSSIEIEIIPNNNKKGKFININKNEEKYFHI